MCQVGFRFHIITFITTFHVSLINHNVPSEELLYERDGINKKIKKSV